MSLYNHDTGYRVAQDKNCKAGIALAKLDAQTFERKILPVFKLTDLAKLYKTWLKLLDVVFEGQIHFSRLKDIILSVFPDLNAQPQGQFKVEEIFPFAICLKALVLNFL